jgi:signal transduction histidine kinase
MFSIINLVIVFIEMFAAGILIAGIVSFLKKYISDRLKKDLYLSVVSLIFFIFITLTVITQISYNLGRPFLELSLLVKLLSTSVLLLSLFLWIYFINKFKLGKIRYINILTYLSWVAFFIFSYLIFISEVNLVYHQEAIEPIAVFSNYVPVWHIWMVMWIALSIAYIRRIFLLPSSGRKRLNLLSSMSCLSIVFAQALFWFYLEDGQSWYLLSAWVLRLFGIAGLMLGESIPAYSKMAETPLSFFRTRILFKLIFIFVLLIVILFEITTLATISISRESLSGAIIKLHQELANDVSGEIENYLERGLEGMRILARNERIINSPAFLSIVPQVDPIYKYIVVVDKKGNIYNSAYKEGVSPLSRSEINSAINNFRTQGRHGIFSGIPYRDKQGNLSIAMAAQVHGNPDEILLGEMDLSFIQKMVEDISYKQNSLVYIVDNRGNLVAHPDEVRAKLKENMAYLQPVKESMGGGSGGGEFADKVEGRMVGAYKYLGRLEWGIIVQQPVSTAYIPIRYMETYSLIFVMVGMILTVIVGIFFARSIEKPIKEIISVTEAVRKGELDRKITVSSLDEIGELARAFNTMTRELRGSQDRLVLSEKLASLGTMAAGMAHEIKNPLVSLRTFSQLLQQKWNDPEFREKFSTIVPQEIERINKIAESLLKFGKPIKVEWGPVNINALLEEVLVLFESETKKNNIRVTTKLASLPEISADSNQIQQVFVNIVLNAIQSMKNGGELTVKTDFGEVVKVRKAGARSRVRKEHGVEEMIWGEDDDVEKDLSEPIPVVFVEISDNGEGIQEDNLKTLFDPFFTTKISGTGMGLAISLRIIEEHKGSIRVRSQIGKGTTFIIMLPQQPEMQKQAIEKKTADD